MSAKKAAITAIECTAFAILVLMTALLIKIGQALPDYFTVYVGAAKVSASVFAFVALYLMGAGVYGLISVVSRLRDGRDGKRAGEERGGAAIRLELALFKLYGVILFSAALYRLYLMAGPNPGPPLCAADGVMAACVGAACVTAIIFAVRKRAKKEE